MPRESGSVQKVGKEAEQHPASQGKKKHVATALPRLSKLPHILKTLRTMGPDEERYVRPPRRYELPRYRKGMKYCTSNEPYLRPVRWCNYRDHDVIALAHELGAYELPDREYAEAAYWWLKGNMWYEMSDWYNAGETLRRGVGACMHFGNVYAALCRCAEIKSRFKGFEFQMTPIMREKFFQLNPQGPDIGNFTGGGDTVPELEMEVLIDGTWMTAYTPQPSALTAGTNGWPITEFGESGADLYFDVVPGSVHRYEAISRRMGIYMKLMTLLAPAVTQRINVKMARQQMRGRKYIEDAAGIEGYNRMARERRAQMSPEEILAERIRERHPNIVVKEPE